MANVFENSNVEPFWHPRFGTGNLGPSAIGWSTQLSEIVAMVSICGHEIEGKDFVPILKVDVRESWFERPSFFQ